MRKWNKMSLEQYFVTIRKDPFYGKGDLNDQLIDTLIKRGKRLTNRKGRVTKIVLIDFFLVKCL